MDQPMVDVDVSIGPLWIRRQVFEHSVAVPLLTTSTASQIDFPQLAAELIAASVVPPPAPPAVTYDAWVAAAGFHARLDSSEHAAIIVEALQTNAPEAFLRCNAPDKLHSAERLPCRQLMIPVPELLAFVKLHAAATISTQFRSFADAVWPDVDASALTSAGNNNSNAQSSPRQVGASVPAATPANVNNVAPLTPISLTPASPRVASAIQAGAAGGAQRAVGVVVGSGGQRAGGVEVDASTQPMQAQSGLQGEAKAQVQSHATNQPHSPPQHAVSSPVLPHTQQQSPQAHSQQSQQQQHSPPLAHAAQPQFNSPLPSTSTAAANNGPSMDTLVRKKSPNHISSIINSQSSIIASAQYALERETRLVVANVKALLLVVASAYGVEFDANMLAENGPHDAAVAAGGVGVRGESGTLSNSATGERARRGQGSSSGAVTGGGDAGGSGGVEGGGARGEGGGHGGDVDEGPNESTTPSGDAVMADGNNAVNKPVSVNQIAVSRSMFEHLSFLLTTTSESSGAFRPMSSIVPEWNDRDSSGTVPLGELVTIVTTALTKVPMQGPVDGVIDVVEVSNLERKTVMRSKMPRVNTVGDGKFAHEIDVRIANCSESHVYLMSSLGRVSFIGCRGSTLFIGGCVSVSLINCENVRVHAIARVCRVTNCFDTHLYLCTNTHPQIVGENRGLVFAPYNVAYPAAYAERHLQAVGVDASRNMWDKFYRPAFRGSTNVERSGELSAAVARTLAPEHFLPFGVPVRGVVSGIQKDLEANADGENGKGNGDLSLKALFRVPVALAPEYEEQLKLKRMELMKVRKEVRDLEKQSLGVAGGKKGMDTSGSDGGGNNGKGDVEGNGKDVAMGERGSNEEGDGDGGKGGEPDRFMRRGVLQMVVQERFREWLNHSGRIRQISDLVRLEQQDHP